MAPWRVWPYLVHDCLTMPVYCPLFKPKPHFRTLTRPLYPFVSPSSGLSPFSAFDYYFNGHTGDGWLSLVGAATAHALILKTRVTVLFPFQKHVHMWVHQQAQEVRHSRDFLHFTQEAGAPGVRVLPKASQLYTKPGLELPRTSATSVSSYNNNW